MQLINVSEWNSLTADNRFAANDRFGNPVWMYFRMDTCEVSLVHPNPGGRLPIGTGKISFNVSEDGLNLLNGGIITAADAYIGWRKHMYHHDVKNLQMMYRASVVSVRKGLNWGYIWRNDNMIVTEKRVSNNPAITGPGMTMEYLCENSYAWTLPADRNMPEVSIGDSLYGVLWDDLLPPWESVA